MQQWEYQVVHIVSDKVITLDALGYPQQGAPQYPQEAYINQLGAQGWELTGVMSGSSNSNFSIFGSLYFKRPKP